MPSTLFSPISLFLSTTFVAVLSIAWSATTCSAQSDFTSSSSNASDLKPVPVAKGIAELLKTNCYDCHGRGEKEGSLALDELLNQSNSDATRQHWWKVLSNVRAGTMPPPSSGTKLSSADIERLNDWIKYQVFQIDPESPDPGRVTVRRLNRNEYANTIRDLMGVDFNADVVFPPDDTGFGFDNIGDALSLSPLVLEKYLSAASEIVLQAVPTVTKVIPTQRFTATDFKSDTGSSGDNMRLHKATEVSREFEVHADGEFEIQIEIKAQGSFEFSPQRCTLAVQLDGETIHEAEYGWNENKIFTYPFERHWQRGSHRLVFQLKPIEPESNTKGDEGAFAELDVHSVTVAGPRDPRRWQHPPRYSDFFHRDEPPTDAAERLAYAKELLERFATRAFRRPVDSKTVDRLAAIAENIYSQSGKTFEEGIAQAMVPVLASPRFLFRIEAADAASLSDKFPLIDEYALASRLSYFLWSTMPDEELFALAKEGKLRKQLDQQIDRMLKSHHAQSLIKNFVGQWLRTRDVEKVTIDGLEAFGVKQEYEALLEEVRRNRSRFRDRNEANADPEFAKKRARFRELAEIRDTLNADVKSAMRRETEMLFETIVREDRSLLELISSDYTFVNEALAKLYGISDVQGREMRRVSLPADSPRGGILSQGTMLIVTSNPTRTSPVKRGLYILENILGTPTPPAPPNVPALEDAANRFGDRKPSLRELLAAHRESALCSSCHSRMDPLGIALENFNALGIHRTEEAGQPIDASGQLITGEEFKDVRDLKRIIVTDRRLDFYRCLTQKLLTYALGRGLEYSDEHTIDDIVTKLDENGGKFNSLVRDIIQSPAFQRQRPRIQSTAVTAKDSAQ